MPTPTWSTGSRTCSPASSAAPATGPASRRAGAGGWRRSRWRSAGSSGWPPITRATSPTGCRNPPRARNGFRVACVGAGPASLTVARDLAPAGYEVVVFDGAERGGGMIRSQIPKFRLPEEVIDEEVGYIERLGVETRYSTWVEQPEGAAGRGLRRGVRRLRRAARARTRRAGPPGSRRATSISASTGCPRVSFGHITSIGRRVMVLGGGNTAMDCCRSARRLGGEEVKRGGAQRVRGDEGVALGKGRRHARGHPDPQLPGAQGGAARRAAG